MALGRGDARPSGAHAQESRQGRATTSATPRCRLPFGRSSRSFALPGPFFSRRSKITRCPCVARHCATQPKVCSTPRSMVPARLWRSESRSTLHSITKRSQRSEAGGRRKLAGRGLAAAPQLPPRNTRNKGVRLDGDRVFAFVETNLAAIMRIFGRWPCRLRQAIGTSAFSRGRTSCAIQTSQPPPR